MEIDILGTKYQFNESTKEKDPALRTAEGYCDYSTKKIVITRENEYDVTDPETVENIGSFLDKVKRHEIIHAYFYESGLHEYSSDEVLVDWVAIQFPKMLDTFKKAGAI